MKKVCVNVSGPFCGDVSPGHDEIRRVPEPPVFFFVGFPIGYPASAKKSRAPLSRGVACGRRKFSLNVSAVLCRVKIFCSTLVDRTPAGKWEIPEEQKRNDLKAINQLGYEYATATDSPEKEARLLKILECFHGYLMKYVIMIVRGTIPPANSRAGAMPRSCFASWHRRARSWTGRRRTLPARCFTWHSSS